MNMMYRIKTKFLSRDFLWSNTVILIYLALAKLVIHLLTANGYGYHGDELYWLAMTKHLDFGYVDVPPLVAYLAAISRALIGASLFAIHIFPAIAGAATVYFAGLVALELGGGRFAQWFSALMMLVAPWLLMANSAFTYEPFDQLCSIILFYLVARIINRETPKRWLILGITAGIGVMTKLSLITTGGVLVVSLLLTSRRKSFLTIWPWLAALIAALICTPYLVWQSVHGWPLLTYWHNYALNPIRTHPLSAQLLIKLIFFLNPVLLPVWLLGLFYLLFHREGKKYLILGLISFILLVLYIGFMKLEPRVFIAACFPLLAAGAVWLERMTITPTVNYKSIAWLKQAYIGVILVSSILLAPLALPILPIPVLEKYLSATPDFIKRSFYEFPTKLPHYFAFEMGWPEIVKEVAAVYHNLPEADQKKCVIWAGWYWDAAAIDLYGKKYGLPNAISNSLSYQVWGSGPLSSGKGPEVAIMLDTDPRQFPASLYFDEVVPAKLFICNEYSVYVFAHSLQIYICRKPKANFQEVWEMCKKYQ
jgi:hypothetical protein